MNKKIDIEIKPGYSYDEFKKIRKKRIISRKNRIKNLSLDLYYGIKRAGGNVETRNFQAAINFEVEEFYKAMHKNMKMIDKLTKLTYEKYRILQDGLLDE